MATYAKAHNRTKPIAAIAVIAAIVAMIAGCNSGNSGQQYNSPGNSNYGSYLNANNQAQNEMNGAVGGQGPGITTNGDNDAGTGGDYDGSGN
jgi:hypothetical protein